MDDTVDIKEEPVWCRVYEEAPESSLPSIKTEASIIRGHDELGGVDQIGQSQVAASFNLAQELLQLKQEIMKEPEPINLAQELLQLRQEIMKEPDFRLAEVDARKPSDVPALDASKPSDVRTVQPLDFSKPSGTDPLPCLPQPLDSQELAGPKQEVMFVDVKQEPIEEEEDGPLQSNEDMLQSSEDNTEFTRSSSWIHHDEDVVNLEPAECSEHVIDALEFVEIVSHDHGLCQMNNNSNDEACGPGDQMSPRNDRIRTLRRRQEEDTQCVILSSQQNNFPHMYNPEKPWVCNLCGKRFKTRYKLLRHGTVHSGVKDYACDVCDKRYTTSGILNTHMRLHTGIKPYSCDECDKQFISSNNLASHKRTHSGVKPYACEECDRRFPFSHALVVHMRSHSGIKPYPCDQCERCFTSSSQLSQHKLRHSGLKPFPCDECEKKFTTTALLASHKRSHQRWKSRMYTCDVCQASYAQRSDLGQHLIKNHLFL